jgi:hypothetical protein
MPVILKEVQGQLSEFEVAHQTKEVNGKVFVEVQDNIEKQLVASYDLQLTEFMDLFKKKDKSDKDREMALKVMKELPSFVAKRKELMEIIGQRTQEVLVEKKESTLEKINKSKIHERSKEEFEG